MARIEWARLCEHAFLDNCDRLCMTGVVTHFPVPSLPLAVHRLMIAARVVGTRPHEACDIGVSVATPNGFWAAPDGPDGFDVEAAGEYLLITLRNFPLTEEGVYRFVVALDAEHPVTLEIPVLLLSARGHAELH
jgi:hypothetical protein